MFTCIIISLFRIQFIKTPALGSGCLVRDGSPCRLGFFWVDRRVLVHEWGDYRTKVRQASDRFWVDADAGDMDEKTMAYSV